LFVSSPVESESVESIYVGVTYWHPKMLSMTFGGYTKQFVGT